MGVSQSTLIGWSVILSVAGYFVYKQWNEKRAKELSKIAAQRRKELDREGVQARRDNKAKRQRMEAFVGDDAKSKPQPKTQPPTRQNKAADYSSDDGADNREFARQLNSVKQGTKFATKSHDEKRQKSVKQSRAQEKDAPAEIEKPSAPSSTAGIDADDDQSPSTSPVVAAADVGGISDMLEKAAPGPSVLRLTDTEEKKKPQKKAKAPEPVETKKQRQNRKKVEAAKIAREEAEQDRKVKMEAQRRLARQAEGRAAKDGSAFMAAQAKPSVWTGNGVNGTSKTQTSFGEDGFIPVQPLDTFEPSSVQTDTSVPSVGKSESWMSSLPSEEEQLERLREEEEAWSTVKTKKGKAKKNGITNDSNTDNFVTEPQVLVPVTNKSASKTQPATNGRPTKAFTQKSSFAALSTNEADDAEEEAEWDV